MPLHSVAEVDGDRHPPARTQLPEPTPLDAAIRPVAAECCPLASDNHTGKGSRSYLRHYWNNLEEAMFWGYIAPGCISAAILLATAAESVD
jgi:hypothetical protein